METNLIYELLGRENQHILACRISHIRDIYKELMGFINDNCLEHFYFYSFVPGRIRDIPQILFDIYNEFEYLVKENRISDVNVMEFMKNFDIFKNIVYYLAKAIKISNYEDIIKYTNELGHFFQTYKLDIEDCEC